MEQAFPAASFIGMHPFAVDRNAGEPFRVFRVAQVFPCKCIDLAEELKKLKDKMKPFLESARTKENIDMLFLLLTDILSENSYVIYAGAEAENILSQGFNQMPVDGEALLEGVVSRKKQFVPVMMGMLMA